ncbi:DUF1566 domain-containing protein [Candidatus Magnetominusculus dajiuhuensis]|uniref:Lcl domain-containing protein n=1 Tax=Candidatus Magnetominusculus dajiuhuensis TaxID=3137712 RepID=UPI003B439A5E
MKLSGTVFVVLILSLSLCYGFGKQSELIVDNVGILTDTGTGLQWYEGPEEPTTWDQANSWVAKLTVGGGGWRMPNMAELRGLYDAGMRKKCSVWSSEFDGTSVVWVLYFNDGSELKFARDGGPQGLWPRAFAVRTRK